MQLVTDRLAPGEGDLACAGTGVEWRAVCADPDGRTRLTAFYALVELLAERSGDPLVGLRIGRDVPLESFDLLGFLSMSAPTLGVALERVCRYQSLFSDERTELSIQGQWAVLTVIPWGPRRPAHRHVGLAALVDIAHGGGALLGRPVRVAWAELAHEAPPNVEPLAALFREPRFDADAYRLAILLEELDAALPGADEALFAFLDKEGTRRVSNLEPLFSADLVDRVERAILDALPSGPPGADDLARSLGMSKRTLQRRLASRGTSLQRVIDDLRQDLALRYLSRGVSLGETAFLLGFSETSAFHRAFRRWHGQTPGDWLDGLTAG